ncbi:uncharacterized protein LOC120288534 [Eucalyptus grandis]|uniref:uncharacterized protein LOC120288534 n=1 Tax=Eucalyptus grandis TaxID=71139 RepID=UPI00192E8B67|nr:uncharacterized protein LOC120288534 [Eucalyptus grandis]
MKRLSFARVCVEISAKLERCEEVEVWVNDKSFSVSVLYEWRPNSCAKCFAFGHNCLANEELKQPLATDAVTNRKKNQNTGQKEKGEVAPPISALKAKVIEDPSSQNASKDLRTQKQGIETDSMALVVSNQNDAAVALSSEEESKDDACAVSSNGSGGDAESAVYPNDPHLGTKVPPNQKNAPKATALATPSSAPKGSNRRRPFRRRGLGDPVKQDDVRNFVRSNNLCCVGIIETKISSAASISVALALLPGWSWVNNYSHSHKGRIWVGWNPRDVDFLVNAVSVQAIHSRLLWLVSGKVLFLSVVYAEHRFNSRRPLWEDLIQTSGTLSSVPWIVAGDFNAIQDPSDRVGGTNAWIPAFDEFRDCLVQAGLDDLRFTGFRYTWSTSSGINRKQRKIDRVLVNGCWNSVFSFSEAAFLPPGISDHTPMVIKVMPTPRSSKPFKFFNFWMSHPEFSRMVTERLDRPFKLLRMLCKRIRSALLLLIQKSNSFKHLQSFVSRRNLSTGKNLDGDTTTSDPSEVQKVFVDHFQNLLAASPTSGCPVKEEIQAVLNHLLVEEQVRFLSSPISDDEIRNTLFSLATGKAPGPDGFNVEFFKRSWDIVGASVIMAVKDFFVTGELLKQINTTIIALVPKIPNASTVHDFRPIACCNTIYKCITKLIANRLARVLPSIVSLPQNTFVKGRHISDNILLAHELFSGFHHDPYRAKCIIKVNFTKAYDTVSWEFIEVCLQAFGFPQIFVDRIMICIRSPKFSICLNGELHGFFASGRGIRQGDPMSPYIFTLVMEVFTGLLDRRTSRPEFGFFWRCKSTKLSHLFFADDVFLFFEATLASVGLLKDGIESFSNWSGLVPNLNKSEVFLLGGSSGLRNDILSMLGFQVGSLPFRYLGVPVISKRLGKADCVTLVNGITACVQSWTHRFLSFAGRL